MSLFNFKTNNNTYSEIVEIMKDFGIPTLNGNGNPNISGWTTTCGDEFDQSYWDDATGFAVNTGRAGLVGIDCDVKGEENGVLAFQEFCAKHDFDLSDVFTVQSPSGGLHYYFKSEEDFKNDVGEVLPGVDIRSKGGALMFNGYKYTDRTKGETGYYEIINIADIPPLPQFIRDILNVKEQIPEPTFNWNDIPEVNPDTLSPTAEDMLQEALGELSQAGPNTRHNALLDASRKAAKFRVPHDIIREQMLATAIAIGSRDSISQMERTIEDGIKRGAEQAARHLASLSAPSQETDFSSLKKASEIKTKVIKHDEPAVEVETQEADAVADVSDLSEEQVMLMNKHISDLFQRNASDGLETVIAHSRDLGSNGIHPSLVQQRLTPIGLSIGLSQHELDEAIPTAANSGYAEFLEIQKQETEEQNRFAHLERLDEDGWTDVAVANYAAEAFDIVYVVDRNAFAIYNPDLGIWEITKESAVVGSIVTESLRKDLHARNAEGDKALRVKIYHHNFHRNIGEALSSFLHTRKKAEEFDAADNHLNFLNGVLDGKTGELKPHDPSYMFFSMIELNYRPEAHHEVVDVILSALPDDAIDWMQVMAGQALAGYQTAKHYNIFLVGDNSNGKSAIQNMLHATGGTFSVRPPQEALSVGGDKFALIDFARARQAVIEELPSRKLDGDRLKSLTGTKIISARGMHESYQHIKNRLTMFISANNLPDVLQLDGGVLRRPIIVPFLKTYSDNPPAGSVSVLPADPRVEHASEDQDILEAFLAWRVKGYLRWMQAKHRATLESALPPSVQEATNEWKLEAEPINVFVFEALEFSPKHGVTLQQLMYEYEKWAAGVGIPKSSWLSGAKLSNILLRQYRNDLRAESVMPTTINPSRSLDVDAPEYKPRQKSIIGIAFRGTVVRQEEADSMKDEYTSKYRGATATFDEDLDDSDPLGLNEVLNTTDVDIQDF